MISNTSRVVRLLHRTGRPVFLLTSNYQRARVKKDKINNSLKGTRMSAKLNKMFSVVESPEIKEVPPIGKKWWRVEFVRTAEWDEHAKMIRQIVGIDPFIKRFFDYILESSHFSYGTTIALTPNPSAKEICEALYENLMQLDRVETGAAGLMKSLCSPPL